MGILKKLLKPSLNPLKAAKNVHSASKQITKKTLGVAKKTTPGMGGGGKGQHLQAARRNASGAGARAGTRGGGIKAQTVSTPTKSRSTLGGGRRTVGNTRLR